MCKPHVYTQGRFCTDFQQLNILVTLRLRNHWETLWGLEGTSLQAAMFNRIGIYTTVSFTCFFQSVMMEAEIFTVLFLLLNDKLPRGWRGFLFTNVNNSSFLFQATWNPYCCNITPSRLRLLATEQSFKDLNFSLLIFYLIFVLKELAIQAPFWKSAGCCWGWSVLLGTSLSAYRQIWDFIDHVMASL